MKKFDLYAVGELNADLILEAEGPLPALGQERQCRNISLVLGSSTAICACVCASLGLRTAFFGRLAPDLFGQVCRETLERYEIDCGRIGAAAGSTGVTVSVSYPRDRALITYPGATIDAFDAAAVPREIFSECRHLHIGSFFLNTRLMAGLPELFAAAHACGVTTSLDAGWDPAEHWDSALYETLRHTDVFFPNESETCAIGGSAACGEAAEAVLAKMAPGGILAVKRGKKGCLIAGGGQRLSVPAFSVEPVDTTGAGDSFNGGFLAAWLRGEKTLTQCAEYACAAAAVSVTRPGGTSACPRPAEVELLLNEKNWETEREA